MSCISYWTPLTFIGTEAGNDKYSWAFSVLPSSTNLRIQLPLWSDQPPPLYWPAQGRHKVLVYQRKRKKAHPAISTAGRTGIYVENNVNGERQLEEDLLWQRCPECPQGQGQSSAGAAGSGVGVGREAPAVRGERDPALPAEGTGAGAGDCGPAAACAGSARPARPRAAGQGQGRAALLGPGKGLGVAGPYTSGPRLLRRDPPGPPARTHHGRPDRTLATSRALLVERPGSPYGTGTGRKAATGCRKAAWGGERELRTPPRDRARGQSRVGVLPAVGGVRSSGGAQAGSGGGPQGGAPSRERVITSARGRPGASGAVRSGERSGTEGTLVEVLQRSVRDTSALGLGR